MKEFFILLGLLLINATNATALDFSRSDPSQEFCKDIVNHLAEFGVRVSHTHMKKCSLLSLAGASATFERPYGDSLHVRVKSKPYRMFVTRGDQIVGTCYVLHPRRVARRVEGRDC